MPGRRGGRPPLHRRRGRDAGGDHALSFRSLGIYIEHPGVGLEEVVSVAREAEAAGFGLLAVGDGFAENFALTGALTAHTRRVELVTAIANWTRSPVTTALGASTLAELAPGRYRFGLGAIPPSWSHDWHGLDGSRPVERMRDFVAAVRTAWRSGPGRPVSHDGPFYRFRNYERPTEPPHGPIPLYLAGNRPRMIELAGEVADGAIFAFLHSAEWLRDVGLPIVERGLAQAGRPRSSFDVGHVVFCAVADSEAEAFDLLRPGLAFHFPHFRDILADHGFADELHGVVSDRAVEAMCVAGTPQQVREKLRRYDGIVDWPCLMPPLGLSPDVSREQVRRIIEAFRQPVAPAAPAGAAAGGPAS